MKKIYFQPATMVVRTTFTMMICGSQDITSDEGITYGGVDKEGELDPESRYQNYDVWEDEVEEEEKEDF
jgi:hypothetical protein